MTTTSLVPGAWRMRAAIMLMSVAFCVVPDAAEALPDFIPLDQIAPGMTGYGLTVFEGAKVDTFGVTVIGVQDKVRAAGSLLMIEVSGHGLEKSSIAQGMSGSPIFIDGRFAGALAFGWGGALRPIAGVTPAAEILALPTWTAETPPQARAVGPGLDALVPPPGASRTLTASLWEPAGDQIGQGQEDWAARRSGAGNWPTPRALLTDMMAGLGLGDGPSLADPAQWIYQPVNASAGGATEPSAARSPGGPALVPGAACSVPLVTGDAHLGVIGTVTWVEDDDVYMMGHPFLQRGPVDLPLATARVLTIFPSRQMSFKMGTMGDIVGSVHHDQRAGLAGRLGPAPQMVDVSIELSLPTGGGTAVRPYTFQVVDDPTLTPTLVFWTLYNTLLVEGDDASLQTLDYHIETLWDGAEPLVLEGVAAGPGGAMGLASQWMAPLQILLNNPYSPVRLRKVTARLKVHRPMATATITGLSGPRQLPPPGSAVVFQVEVQPRLGAKQIIRVPVVLPVTMDPGPYRVVAASAAELFAIESQRAPERFQVSSLGGIQEILRMERSAGTLSLALLSPGKTIILNGNEMTDLPPSLAQALRTGNMQAGRTMADYLLRANQPTDWVLGGHAVRALTLQPLEEPIKEERRP